jgi:hypothetical protein
MIPINDNESAVQAKYALELALLSGAPWELWSSEKLITTLVSAPPQEYALSIEWGKLIFAWWNDGAAQSWRVTSYDITPAEIRLRSTRSFGRDLTTLTLRASASSRVKTLPDILNLAEQRHFYAQALPQLLSQYFAEAHVQVLPGTNRSQLGTPPYVRLRLHKGRENILAIGVNEAEPQPEIDGIVAAGLLWLARHTQPADGQRQIQRLCFCLPAQRSQTVIERLSLLSPQPFGAQVECLEVAPRYERLSPLSLATQIELINLHARELRWPAASTKPGVWRERILQLAPELIEIRPHPQLEAESFRIHGLEFARVNQRGLERASFGVAGLAAESGFPAQQSLTEANFAQLAALVRQIRDFRCAQTPNRQHPLYRLRAEAWLESLLRRNLRALDAKLDERFIYSQIPAWRADERAVLDLLTVTQTGRLVVIEVKASEDPQLPFQGLDYWLRVEQARARGELRQRGLFAGLQLTDQPPLLYLVAPRLRFHRSFTTLARCLAPEIEVYRLGLNTNWRVGLHVHTRERLNAVEAL